MILITGISSLFYKLLLIKLQIKDRKILDNIMQMSFQWLDWITNHMETSRYLV